MKNYREILEKKEELKVGDKIKYKKNSKGQIKSGVVSSTVNKNGYVLINNGATAVDVYDILEKKEEKGGIYTIRVTGNFYGGKYYETGIDSFFVLASSSEEALKLAQNNVDTITDMFKGKKYNGKPAIAKKDTIKIKVSGEAPKLSGMKKAKKVLTKNNKFEAV